MMLYLYMQITRSFWHWPRDAGIILAYHQVSARRFEQQLRWLTKRYVPLNLHDFILHLEAGTLPFGAFAVTFDDGYIQIYEELAEIASRYSTPLTIYMVAEAIHDRKFWFARYLNLVSLNSPSLTQKIPARPDFLQMPVEERLRLLDHLESMVQDTKDMVRTMHADELRSVSSLRHIEIGGHTVNHQFLSRLNDREAVEEILCANRFIEWVTRRPVRHFAYPFGDYSDATASIIKRLGLLSAVTGDYGCNTPELFDSYKLKRIIAGNMPLVSFAVRVSGLRKRSASFCGELSSSCGN
jgi:peptidoglycan/xylan/chitin deacetylase (PgdA/CDA1 family)